MADILKLSKTGMMTATLTTEVSDSLSIKCRTRPPLGKLINYIFYDLNRLLNRLSSIRQSIAMTADPWVSVDQISEHPGCSHDSIYFWSDRKGLPVWGVVCLWKFKVSEADKWVRAGGADEA